MDHRFTNALLAKASAQTNAITAAPLFGIVTSYDPARYMVKVALQPSGVLTGWLPVLSQSVGNGNGIMVGPQLGQQAFLVAQEGDAESYVVAGFGYSQLNQPPIPQNAINGDPVTVKAGEIALVSPFGSVIRLCEDGSIFIQASDVNIEGHLKVYGNITSLHGDVADDINSLDHLRQNYNQHEHTGVSSGSDTSGTTTKTDP